MQATLHYSEDLVRYAVRSFWWRQTGWGLVGGLGFLALPIAYLLSVGDRSWLVGGFLLGWLFAATIMAILYISHMTQSLSRLRRMEDPEATIELTENVLRLTSDVAKSEVAWRAVREIWCFPRVWLVLFSASQFATLPVGDLSPEFRDLLLTKVRAAGGRIA